MPTTPQDWDRDGLWSPYIPTERVPWNLRRVVHLHRRAGFAATWTEIQRDLRDGPARSVERLLQGQTRERTEENFTTVADHLADTSDAARLKAWWFYRMFAGPDTLGERLTLMWHNHFATSNEKVRNTGLMRRQNDLFRRLGRGPFGELLRAVVHDPALLVYLDAPANRAGRPNENLSRELMELFTLGVGSFNETDVREAARALTGWMVLNGAFHVRVRDHDDGEKTILGQTGRFNGDDLLRILLDQPSVVQRIAWRLCDGFMGEKRVPATAVRALADGLRQNNLNVGWAVTTVLQSRAFFADDNIGNRVHGPVEFVVGAARALECYNPPPSNVLLAEWSARLGQDLFYPPNVGGWPGGRGWLTTQSIIGRANFAAAAVQGQISSRSTTWDAIAFVNRHGRGRDLDDVVTFAAELVTGAAPDEAWRRRLLSTLGANTTLTPDNARTVFALVMASPEMQMA